MSWKVIISQRFISVHKRLPLKIYERIIHFKLRKQVENKLREEKYGFVDKMSTVDLICAVRQILEKRWESDRHMIWFLLILERHIVGLE
jgi:hypothetical protein